MGHNVTEQKEKQQTQNNRKWLSRLPRTSQTHPVAAEEGLQTETEKKRKEEGRKVGEGGGGDKKIKGGRKE